MLHVCRFLSEKYDANKALGSLLPLTNKMPLWINLYGRTQNNTALLCERKRVHTQAVICQTQFVFGSSYRKLKPTVSPTSASQSTSTWNWIAWRLNLRASKQINDCFPPWKFKQDIPKDCHSRPTPSLTDLRGAFALLVQKWCPWMTFSLVNPCVMFSSWESPLIPIGSCTESGWIKNGSAGPTQGQNWTNHHQFANTKT